MHRIVFVVALLVSSHPVADAFHCATNNGVAAMRISSSPSALHTKHSPCYDRKLVQMDSSKEDEANDWNLFRRRTNNIKPASSYASRNEPYQELNDKSSAQNSFITREMEQQVMASARATLDDKTVSRAISFLVADNDTSKRRRDSTINNPSNLSNINNRGNTLRDLAGGIRTSPSNEIDRFDQGDTNNNNSWDTQQIAIASGVTTCLLSPIIIPIIHSLIPPVLPFPASISFEGAAFLGTLAYILALGDPTDQSNVIAKTTSGGMLGDGVEVTGAMSRIVGRTALQSVQVSAPRLKAVARAVVDYDNTINTMEELKDMQYQLSRRLLELESENDNLRQEVALWNAVEDLSSDYKLEELKELARVNGIRGYSSDGKTALLRRLVKERVLNLDLAAYYPSLDDI